MIQQYLVVVVKGQGNELPSKNWELLRRLDPDSPELTDDEWAKMYNPEGKGILVISNILQLDGKTQKLTTLFGRLNLATR